jgi:hypothetical protein
MRIYRVKHQLINWIAVFAFLLSAAAPSISHSIFGSFLQDQNVCSSSGAKVALGDTGQSVPKDQNGSGVLKDLCGYCSLPGSFILPGQAFDNDLFIAFDHSFFTYSVSPNYSERDWLHLPSQGPPEFV